MEMALTVGGIEMRVGRLRSCSGRAWLGAAAAVGAIVAGCGDGSGRGSAVPSGCPSASAVAEAIGADVISAGGSSGSGHGDGFEYESQGCVYRLAPEAAPAEVQAGAEGTVRIERLRSESTGLFTLLAAPAENPKLPRPFEPVTGLGDDARIDGDELAVLMGDAIVFVRVSLATASVIDPVAGATLVAGAVASLGLDAGAALDCEDLAPLVVGELGPLNPTPAAAPQPASGDRSVGGVALQAEGCRFDLASGDLAFVLLADPSQWSAWVYAKQRSPARTRFVEREVAGRPAVHLAGALLVDDSPDVLRVETQDVAGDDAELDRAREALADLVLG